MLNFTREIIKLRREKLALHRGDLTLLTRQPKDTLAYLRQTPEQTILVALNFKNHATTLDNVPAGNWHLMHSTTRDSIPESVQSLRLFPYEVLIMESV
jgi:glycosidase